MIFHTTALLFSFTKYPTNNFSQVASHSKRLFNKTNNYFCCHKSPIIKATPLSPYICFATASNITAGYSSLVITKTRLRKRNTGITSMCKNDFSTQQLVPLISMFCRTELQLQHSTTAIMWCAVVVQHLKLDTVNWRNVSLRFER